MKYIISIILLLFTNNIYADWYTSCQNITRAKIDRLTPNNKLRDNLAKNLCAYCYISEIDLLISIAYIESGIKQINSKSGEDIGIFQIHKNEIKHRGSDILLLQINVQYQVIVAKEILIEKYYNCKDIYPKTWPACYNSATKKQHSVYWNKLVKIYNKIKNIGIKDGTFKIHKK